MIREYLVPRPSEWDVGIGGSHMIEEYARHNGHADLLRERIDGATGDRLRRCGQGRTRAGSATRSTLVCVERILRSTVWCVFVSIALLACTSPATDNGSESTREPGAGPEGVTLVLVATDPDGCCRVFTSNPGPTNITVACGLVALDPAGRLIYSGVVPARLPGHLRSSGFVAPPGRHLQGVVRLPIDPALDTYTAPCRPAAWHGSAPL